MTARARSLTRMANLLGRLIAIGVQVAARDQRNGWRRVGLVSRIRSVVFAAMNGPARCSVAELNGFHYRALRRLSTKDDVTLADVGETCERVPPSSLPALLASNKIEPVETAKLRRRKEEV